MKKMIILLLAAAMLLCLAACAPDDSDGTAAGTTEATTAATIDPNAVLGCICGANDGEDHIGRCKGEEVVWTAWSDINWPTESGYYYADHEGSEVTLDYTDYTLLLGSDDLPRDIVVDLNGKTFLVPGDEPVILDSEMTLTITDSSQGHTGIVTANQDLTQTTRHALFSLPNAEEGTTASLNIYRVTLDASAIKRGNKDGAVISVTQTNILNVYGATIKGGDVVGNGGAVYNAGTANLYDSTIYGGNVIGSDEDNQTDSSGLGGAIHTSGSLSMVDCTIHGSQAGRGGALSIVGCAIYGVTIVTLYTISSVYHGLRPGTSKKVMQVIDHCTIYFLIAGTYTPILMAAFIPKYPFIGWGMLAAEWILVALAATLTAIDLKKYNVFSMICYIGMGWGIVLFLRKTIELMTMPGFILLLSGGIAYTIGAVLYGIGSKKHWMHSVFHIFVVIGSLLQFFAIYFYVL